MKIMKCVTITNNKPLTVISDKVRRFSNGIDERKKSPHISIENCENVIKPVKSNFENSKVKSIKTETKKIRKKKNSSNESNNIVNCDVTPRKNELNIQMLSTKLYQQIFKEYTQQNLPDPNLISLAQKELKSHNLWKENIDFLKDVSLQLPPFKGNNIEEHFWNIGSEQSKPYENLILNFIKKGIPEPPAEWLFQKGWTKYVPGEKPETVKFPECEALVFDVEVCVKLGDLPTLATAVSENAWYAWINSDLAEGTNPVPSNYYSTNMLIPFEGKTVGKEIPRIIVGHNVSYDRARIREQYYLKNSVLRFLDTMSLHICVAGLTQGQKLILQKKSSEDDLVSSKSISCLSSLKDVYSLYCNKELEKEKRNIFLTGEMSDVRKDFQSLMKYCSNDVTATFEVLQALFPVFIKRFPHPVTLAGMLEMGTAFLPVNENWKKFLAEAEQTYDDLKNEISLMLSKKSDNACRLFHNEDYKNDLWMWDEDWSTQELKLVKRKLKPKKVDGEKKSENSLEIEENCEEENFLAKKFQYLFDLEELLPVRKPFLPGYPLWYRKLCKKPTSEDWTPNTQLSTSMVVTPKLLQLTWENFPLYHTREFGWGILVADIFAENVESALPFEYIKELTIKNCNIDLDQPVSKYMVCRSTKRKNVEFPVPYYRGTGVWCDHMVDNCCYFFKLPHKDGSSQNVGSPLSKDFTQILSDNILKGSDSVAEKVLDLGKKLSYWRNNRERVLGQMVVWLNKKSTNTGEEEPPVGVIIPKVVVCGTLTRRAMESTWLTASKVAQNRIGSELRSMIQAPPGYHIVGADVDSQELWIASLIGDSHQGKMHGCTPLGWMTLSGTKSNGTDMHSMTAKAVGISRDHAKVINYARIYGAGINFAQKLLQKFNPSMNGKEAQLKATKMYDYTKGKRVYKIKENVKEEFQKTFGDDLKIYDLPSAVQLAKFWNKRLDEVFEKSHWVGGTESSMFNQLENIANSPTPVTPFLNCRLSRALEPKFKGDNFHLRTRINWVVQSGAVDFLHLMLVCMRWLTNGKARYCFSFHDEVRYLVPSEMRYNAALAMHITNLLVRAFCSHRLGMYDLPQSVAFFSSVEVDKTIRKEADDDCITPSNPHGIEKGYGIPPGESLNIYEALEKSGESLSPFATGKTQKCLKPQKENMCTEKFCKAS